MINLRLRIKQKLIKYLMKKRTNKNKNKKKKK